MSLFGYYAWHSFKNQLKKLFKTWVVVFIVVCMLIGGLIGGGIATLENMAENQNQGTEIDEPIDLPVEDPETDIPVDQGRTAQVVEMIAGIAALGLMLLFIKGADKNGSAIFLPADVMLLFTSPMKPQAVLAFRTMCTIGLVLVTSIYMIFQLPNLIINVGLSVWQALSLLVAWFFVFLFGQLIKIYLYTLCSTKEHLKKYITPAIITVIGIAGLGYVVFHVTHGMTPLGSAIAFFNSPVSRFIPIWGWTKGIVGASFDGSLSSFLIYIGLNILAAGLITAFTWRIKADFYEDAMAKSEETAALMRDIQENGGLYARRKKKDRSETLLRDDFHHGWGANVFYYKSMYNRRRFGIAKVFTKTTLAYLGVAAIISVLFLKVFENAANGQMVVALALGVMAFYRTLGNPLETDTKSQYFVLIPEPVGKKIFYSLLGSCVNCMLDLIPGMVLACVLLRGSILDMIGWMLFIVSIDAYATIVGTFIGLSVPTSAGVNIKQIVQIMFIYFGLLPDIGIMAVGLVMDEVFIASLIAVAVNLALFGIFFALTTNFISPVSRRAEGMTLSSEELKVGKKTFSKVCFVPLLMSLVATLVQIAVVTGALFMGIDTGSINGYIWLLNFVPMYALGLPIGMLALKKTKADKLEEHRFGFLDLLKALTVCFAMMYAGNIIGILVSSLITSITGAESDFIVGDLISEGDTLWIVIFVVILGPIVEEFIFRKLMIDRLSRYGRWLAIVFSSLVFGLFHGNLNQFFYAAALGLVFGYVYTKTGRLRYSVILHMVVNFFGSVVSVYVANNIDYDTIDGMLQGSVPMDISGSGIVVLGAYVLLMLALGITGLIVLFSSLRKLELAPAETPIRKELRFKTAYLSLGFICVVLYFVVMTIITFTGLGV